MEEDLLLASLRDELRVARHTIEQLKVQLFEEFVFPFPLSSNQMTNLKLPSYSGFQTRLDEEVAEHEVGHLAKIQSLSTQLGEANAEREEQVGALRRALESANRDLELLREEASRAKADTEQLKEDRWAMEEHIRETRNQMAMRDETNDRLLKDVESLTAQVQEKETVKSALQGEVASLNQQLENAQALMSDRETISESQQRKLDASTAEINDLHKALDQVRSSMGQDLDLARTELAQSQKLLGDRERASEALQQQLDQRVRDVDLARGEAASVRSEMGETVELVRKELAGVRELLSQRELAQSQLERAVDNGLHECKLARDETERVRMELGNALEEERARSAVTLDMWEAKNQQAEQLETDYETAMYQVKQTQDLLATRDRNAENLLKTADEAAAQAKLATQERENLRSEMGREISHLRQQLGETKQLLSDRETISESQHRKLDSVTAELDALHKELGQVRSAFGEEVDLARALLAQSQKLLGDREHASEALQQKLDQRVRDVDLARQETATVRSEMGETVEQVRKELAGVREMLAQRELAQSQFERAVDASTQDCKLAREETQRVRAEMGFTVEEERSRTAAVRDELDSKNLATERTEAELELVQRHLDETRQLLAMRDSSAENLLKTADEAAIQAKLATQERENLRSELGREISKLRSQVGDLKHLLSDRETISESQQRKLDAGAAELDLLHKELDALRSGFGEEIDLARAQLVQSQKLLGDREHASEALQQQLDQRVRDVDLARQETATVRSEMGETVESVRKELAGVREMLAQREMAQEIAVRMVDESREDCKLAREETERVRAEMGVAVSEERSTANTYQAMLAARNLAGEDLQQQLDVSVLENKYTRREIDDLRIVNGALVKDLRSKLDEQSKLHEAKVEELEHTIASAPKPTAKRPASGKYVLGAAVSLIPLFSLLEMKSRL
ncbi:hypothetical protein BASA81_000886 [Batrachochytrium salamandrivorans]|nr:hypothetical protein BASA81_000886 [Batrachochytrium salamandrivorans]